jgi:hypothetical protein
MTANNSSDNAASPPAAKLGWDRISRMLVNLPFGRQPDPAGWQIPLLQVRQADEPDPELAERLAAAFYRAINEGGSQGDGLWRSMRLTYHGAILDVLEARDFEALAELLAGFFYAPVSAGLCSRHADDNLAAQDPMTRLLAVDVVVSLGTALGLRPRANPAVPDPPNVFELDIEAQLEAIGDKLGWDLLPPQVGGLAGLPFRGQIIPLKYLYQVYAAHRLQAIAGGHISSCLEIGGGVGFLGYFCASNGIVRDYTIIDLPLVNLLQGYLLLRSDVADRVELFGESSQATTDSPRLRVFPDIAIGKLADKSVTMAINQDSFPEMDHNTMTRYLGEIVRIAESHLLSINHESAQQVSDTFSHGCVHTAAKTVPGLEQLSRTPSWLRPGYVEEVFCIRAG